MGATGQIFLISKFPETLSFVIIPRMFWRSLTKIGWIHIPYKFAQSGCIPPKIKCEILAHKGSQTTSAMPQTNRTTGPPGINDDGSRFPGKCNHNRLLGKVRFFLGGEGWGLRGEGHQWKWAPKGEGHTLFFSYSRGGSHLFQNF